MKLRLPRLGTSRNGLGPSSTEVEQVAQGPLRVTGGGLDLDHIGAQVGQDGTGRGDERPVRHLDHTNTFKWARHFPSPSRRIRRHATGDDYVVGPPTCCVRQLMYNVCMVSKTARLSLRLTPEQDAVLRRAAEARGESANDYVLRHAVEAAEMELADRRVFVVDDDAWSELQELLSQQPELPPAMITLLTNSSVLERPA